MGGIEPPGITPTYRGSRKHVLDWVCLDTFDVELLALMQGLPVRVNEQSRWMPVSYKRPEEARLEQFGPCWMPPLPQWAALQSWWLAHPDRANTPNWDIALGCEIEGRPGLVLVEAKAHVDELSSKPKDSPNTTSIKSQENHKQIGAAIAQARAALSSAGFDTGISQDTHYQLSNRIAFLWWLAQAGIPVVLIYLGFIKDRPLDYGPQPLRDAAHWHEAFESHAREIRVANMFERRLDIGSAPAWFLIRSRPVLELSPTNHDMPWDLQVCDDQRFLS